MAQKAANEAKQQARHQLVDIKQSMSGRKEDLEEKIQKMVAMTKTISASRQKALKENAKLDAATKIARDKGIQIDD